MSIEALLQRAEKLRAELGRFLNDLFFIMQSIIKSNFLNFSIYKPDIFRYRSRDAQNRT